MISKTDSFQFSTKGACTFLLQENISKLLQLNTTPQTDLISFMLLIRKKVLRVPMWIALPSLHWGSLEITRIFPLTTWNYPYIPFNYLSLLRSRTCTEPEAQFGGKPCDGISSESKQCYRDGRFMFKGTVSVILSDTLYKDFMPD